MTSHPQPDSPGALVQALRHRGVAITVSTKGILKVGRGTTPAERQYIGAHRSEVVAVLQALAVLDEHEAAAQAIVERLLRLAIPPPKRVVQFRTARGIVPLTGLTPDELRGFIEAGQASVEDARAWSRANRQSTFSW